ncbi:MULTISPECIES: C4-dicarboxylate TRAP transporter substrate-binding protein [unclassified Yoonia]|uniref:C4-dicarboxylate TRAP transporter substrate-binding protein n=1 Tax=unclassified Yoonia TaxID=2629118 RepID=UPI002AFFF98E|nr:MULTISPECIES: C4-dicarboxylate TRAP transporter substrate-binding protein [unclassified Yoonia]
MKHLRTTAIAAILALPTYAAAQETISLTVASSHPTTIPWVGMIQTHFMAETDRILAEAGNYEILWDEAFGGTLYRANATLTSVEQGITDIGWVFSYLEGAKMPLSQVTAYTPFATSNVPVQLSVMRELFNENEAFRNEWEQYNIVMLGMTASDSYDLYTKTPVATLADLDGMRISAPGVLGTWLRGTGASAVDGALTTFYTDIQTGVSDGVLSLALGALPTRIYEVAPYVTRVQMGTVFSGGVAINRDRWESLPEEVQQAMLDAGAYYSEAHAQDMMDRPAVAMEQIATLGAEQNPPVTIVEMDPAERQAWVDALPNLAGEWAAENDGRGLPAAEFLAAYMDGLRAGGETPARDWSAE